MIIEHEAGVPAGAHVVPRERGAVVLAHGEATGHAHRIVSPGARLYEHASERFLDVLESTALLHEEHDPIPVPPGVYRIVRQREYNPDAPAIPVED